jgi:hypothetical protein
MQSVTEAVGNSLFQQRYNVIEQATFSEDLRVAHFDRNYEPHRFVIDIRSGILPTRMKLL